MQAVDYDQLRTLVNAGSVLSIAFEAVGKDFALKVKTPKGEAILVLANARDTPRLFADLRRGLLLLSDIGIKQVSVDASKWEPKQHELGLTRRKKEAATKKRSPAKASTGNTTKKA